MKSLNWSITGNEFHFKKSRILCTCQINIVGGGGAYHVWGVCPSLQSVLSLGATTHTLGFSQTLRTKNTCRGRLWEGEASAGAPTHQGSACDRWTTEEPPKSWRPTSTTAGRSSGSPSCVTSSLDTPKGQYRARGRGPGTPGCCPAWATRGAPSPVPVPPQLCLRRVCQ